MQKNGMNLENIQAERFFISWDALFYERNKKESCLRDSPPAAGRFGDMIPYRRSAILAERFLFHGTLFPMK
ncbi:hypothetical protein [Anaerostipes sp.]|uniref:hypothetical protein n=1 Tax=Anaerostipes sp. TaxID=1872530 RepID=UPI0025BC89E1|nr:hypothetical protein [Anaerostipes sp.]MBS7008333.1 hypothetical protein [Anaerostipes sp.]